VEFRAALALDGLSHTSVYVCGSCASNRVGGRRGLCVSVGVSGWTLLVVLWLKCPEGRLAGRLYCAELGWADFEAGALPAGRTLAENSGAASLPTGNLCQHLSDSTEHVLLLLTLHTRLVAGGRERLISGLGSVEPIGVGVESCVRVASGHFECVYLWIECV